MSTLVRGSDAENTHTFTTTENGPSVTNSAGCMWFTLLVKGTGDVATSWTVNLQTSVDGTNWTTDLTHTSTSDDDGTTIANVTPIVARYFRLNCSALTLTPATALVATVLGND